MSTSIEEAFIVDFDSDVKLAYQNEGSHLRGTTRIKPQINGKSARFQKIGTGYASTKARHADIPPMNLDHSYVDVLLQDTYTGEYVDELDELKTNIDERGAIAQTASMAQGRESDLKIIRALETSGNINATAETWSSASGPIGIMEEFGENNIPLNRGNTWAIVCFRAWGDLLDLDEFSNSDYISPDQLPLRDGVLTSKKWLGFNWMPHVDNAKPAADETHNYFYHQLAMGHAIQKEVEARATYEGPKWGYFLATAMAQNGVIIDDDGVRVRTYATPAA